MCTVSIACGLGEASAIGMTSTVAWAADEARTAKRLHHHDTAVTNGINTSVRVVASTHVGTAPITLGWINFHTKTKPITRDAAAIKIVSTRREGERSCTTQPFEHAPMATDGGRGTIENNPSIHAGDCQSRAKASAQPSPV